MEPELALISGVKVNPLKIIHNPKGNIFRAIKNSDKGFSGFGEAYFSSINQGKIKGWRKHKKMVMNLIVPNGEVGFHFFCDGKTESLLVGSSNYVRVTVEPNTWMAFEGIGEGINLILNVASVLHDPSETETADISSYPLRRLGVSL